MKFVYRAIGQRLDGFGEQKEVIHEFVSFEEAFERARNLWSWERRIVQIWVNDKLITAITLD